MAIKIDPDDLNQGSSLAVAGAIWATGTGADVMRRIAAPMVGGVFTSFLAELIVFPAIYFIWRAMRLEKGPLFPRPGHGPGPRTARTDA